MSQNGSISVSLDLETLESVKKEAYALGQSVSQWIGDAARMKLKSKVAKNGAWGIQMTKAQKLLKAYKRLSLPEVMAKLGFRPDGCEPSPQKDQSSKKGASK